MTKEVRLYNGGKIASSMNSIGKTDGCMHKNQPGILSRTIYKSTLKMNQTLQCKAWSHETPRRKHRQYTLTSVLAIFSRSVPQSKGNKRRINQWDSIQLKSFSMAKESIHKMKRQHTEHDKIFANNISEKGFLSKIDEELTQLSLQKPKIQLKVGTEHFSRVCTAGQETHETIINITYH